MYDRRLGDNKVHVGIYTYDTRVIFNGNLAEYLWMEI